MELHSCRVRKKISDGLESYGLADIKISVDSAFPGEQGFGTFSAESVSFSGPQGLSIKRSVTGYDSQNVSKIVWSTIKYEGERYQTLTNDQLIDEYVRTNSFLYADSIGYTERDSGTLFEIIQKPWSPQSPLIRRFGYDPYYLTNNARVYVRWYYYPKIGYEFEAYEYYALGTASPVTDIIVDVTPLLDGDEDIDFPRFELSFSPVSYTVQSSLAYVTSQAVNGTLTNPEGRVFPKDGSFIATDDQIKLEGGSQYSDANLNEINTPSTIKKRVDIVSPEKSDGVNIEQTFIVTADNTLSYPGPNIKFKSWEPTIKDIQIVQETVDLWKKKVPNYDIKIATPNYQSPTASLEYKTPFGTASVQGVNKGGATGGSASNIKLNVVFPPEFEPLVRETLPQFSVWLGDPQLDSPVDGFVFQDENAELEIGGEYTEASFEGPEENFLGESLYNEDEFERLLLEGEFSKPVTMDVSSSSPSSTSETPISEESLNNTPGGSLTEKSTGTYTTTLPAESNKGSVNIKAGFNGVPYYQQFDARWALVIYGKAEDGTFVEAKVPYKKGEKGPKKVTWNGKEYIIICDHAKGEKGYSSIQGGGCGITSTSMIINYWMIKKKTGKYTSPVKIAKLACESGARPAKKTPNVHGDYPGYVCNGTGPGGGMYKKIKEAFGLNMASSNSSEAQKLVDGGTPVLFCGQNFSGKTGNSGKSTTYGGHFVVITGKDSSGKYRVNDPGANPNNGISYFESWPKGSFWKITD